MRLGLSLQLSGLGRSSFGRQSCFSSLAVSCLSRPHKSPQASSSVKALNIVHGGAVCST